MKTLRWLRSHLLITWTWPSDWGWTFSFSEEQRAESIRANGPWWSVRLGVDGDLRFWWLRILGFEVSVLVPAL